MATKRINDLTNVATLEDFVLGTFGVLDSSLITKKLPAELLTILRSLVISSNSAWLYLITDSVGTFLFGISRDGSVDWAKGIPDHIRVPLETALNTLPTKVDKEMGKSLINADFANAVSVITSLNSAHKEPL